MHFPRPIAGVILLGCLWPATAGAWQAESPARETPKVQEYLRIFVPAEDKRVEQWPRQGVRYAPPVTEEEFQRRLAGLQAEEVPAAAAVRIVEAEYAARFDGSQLLDGNAQLQLTRLRAGAVLVPLGGCGLAIGEAKSALPSEAAAPIGRDAAGQPVAVVGAEAADLQFGWSLRGSLSGDNSVSFRLRLPACPLNRVLLDLPPGFVPAVDAGLVVGRTSAAAESETGAAAGPAAAAAPQGSSNTQRWQVDLGSHTEVRLQIAPAADKSERAVGVLCEQHGTYTFAPDGVTLTTELRLNASARSGGQTGTCGGPPPDGHRCVAGPRRTPNR